MDPAAEADDLEASAALLDAFADDRYHRAARWYRGGTRTFVDSLDTADQYRRDAAAKRQRAAELRAGGAHAAPVRSDLFTEMHAQITKQLMERKHG